MVTFKTANKKQQKLRLAITGLAGSGKTFSALRIASGMGNKIAVIDSEHSSSELYANRFKFDICTLNTFEIEEYVDAIESAGNAGYDVIIIDSLSHAWDKLLERVDKIADQRYRGNTFRAWSEGGELQKKLVESILSSPCHVIGTIRTKAEYAVDNNDGKTKITKLGTAPKQREGFEYELSLVMELSHKHTGFISKDRTGKFQDKYIDMPGEEFGKELIAWLNDGEIDYDKLTQDTLKEIGNIMKSKSEKDTPYFTDKEIDDIRAKCKDSASKPKEERLKYLTDLLTEQKSLLHKKASQEETDNPVIQKQDEQTTTQSTVPTEKPQPKSNGRSLKDDFEKMVQGKNQSQNETVSDLPPMFTEPEPDDFVDDIPGDEVTAETEQQEIF